MWTRPRRERNDLTFAKFVTTWAFFPFLLFSDPGRNSIDFHHRRAARHHTHTYMLHAPCKCVPACSCSFWARRPRRFPHTPTPLDNPRTAAGPGILFLSVSTSFETTLAGPRQMGDHQPWEGVGGEGWAGCLAASTRPPFSLAIDQNHILHPILFLSPSSSPVRKRVGMMKETHSPQSRPGR